MAASPSNLIPLLISDDLTRSLAFYRDVLGASETYRFPKGEAPIFVMMQLGKAEFAISITPEEAPHRQPQRPTMGHRIEFCLYVEDLDAMVAKVRAAGGAIIREPTVMAWGDRVAYVGDPDGNILMLGPAPVLT